MTWTTSSLWICSGSVSKRKEQLGSQAIREKFQELLSRSAEKSARILDRGADDLEAMFGIDLDSPGG